MANTGNLGHIARNVRRLREERELTREALAFHTGLSWSAIEQIESGRRRDLRVSTLAALAGALGCKMDDLLIPEDEQPGFLHEALLYETEIDFARGCEPLVRKGIADSAATLVITTPEKLRAFIKTLGPESENVELVDSAIWYRTPAKALQQIESFANENSHRGVRVIGEPVWTYHTESEKSAWARYESLLNLVFAGVAAHVICPYDLTSLPTDVIEGANRTHPRVVQSGEARASETYLDPHEFILT